MCRLGGGVAPNQMLLNAAALAARLLVSMRMIDSPGAMLGRPLIGTAEAKLKELSSIFQPVMSAGAVPMFVTSNQSAPRELLPLDHGATSEMMSCAAPPVAAVTLRV